MIDLSISETLLTQMAVQEMLKGELLPSDQRIFEGVLMKLSLSEAGMLVQESIDARVREIREKAEKQKPLRITFSGTVNGIR